LSLIHLFLIKALLRKEHGMNEGVGLMLPVIPYKPNYG